MHTAAAEVGQGLVTVEQQIAAPSSASQRVIVHPKDTGVGSGGSTSASRQTYVTGGAVKAACEKVRERALDGHPAADRAHRAGPAARRRQGGLAAARASSATWPTCSATRSIEETVEWHHRPTEAVDPETGQGFAHVQYAFSAHRAVVDVDTELGLIKVVALDCAQDVGKAINPQAVVGQIQGGSGAGPGAGA